MWPTEMSYYIWSVEMTPSTTKKPFFSVENNSASWVTQIPKLGSKTQKDLPTKYPFLKQCLGCWYRKLWTWSRIQATQVLGIGILWFRSRPRRLPRPKTPQKPNESVSIEGKIEMGILGWREWEKFKVVGLWYNVMVIYGVSMGSRGCLPFKLERIRIPLMVALSERKAKAIWTRKLGMYGRMGIKYTLQSVSLEPIGQCRMGLLRFYSLSLFFIFLDFFFFYYSPSLWVLN